MCLTSLGVTPDLVTHPSFSGVHLSHLLQETLKAVKSIIDHHLIHTKIVQSHTNKPLNPLFEVRADLPTGDRM